MPGPVFRHRFFFDVLNLEKYIPLSTLQDPGGKGEHNYFYCERRNDHE